MVNKFKLNELNLNDIELSPLQKPNKDSTYVKMTSMISHKESKILNVVIKDVRFQFGASRFEKGGEETNKTFNVSVNVDEMSKDNQTNLYALEEKIMSFARDNVKKILGKDYNERKKETNDAILETYFYSFIKKSEKYSPLLKLDIRQKYGENKYDIICFDKKTKEKIQMTEQSIPDVVRRGCKADIIIQALPFKVMTKRCGMNWKITRMIIDTNSGEDDVMFSDEELADDMNQKLSLGGQETIDDLSVM